MAKRERAWFVIIAVVGIVVALLAGVLLRARPSEVHAEADGAQACAVVELEGSGDTTELHIELRR